MTDPVQLAPKLDLAAASDLKTLLSEQKEDEVVLDFSEVKHLGALCLQVLVSAASTLNAENRKLSMLNVSERVVDQLRVMGMTPETVSEGRK